MHASFPATLPYSPDVLQDTQLLEATQGMESPVGSQELSPKSKEVEVA